MATVQPPETTTDTECIELSAGSGYKSTTGAIFDAYCNTNWAEYSLYLVFTPDFLTCINSCAEWSTNNTETCVGVVWDAIAYGPQLLAGGFQCYYKWSMPGQPLPTPTIHFYSAKMRDAGQINLVCDGHCECPDICNKNTTSPASSIYTTIPTSTSGIVTSKTQLSATSIGGIVGGVLAGLVVLGVIILLWRYSKLPQHVPQHEITLAARLRHDQTEDSTNEFPLDDFETAGARLQVSGLDMQPGGRLNSDNSDHVDRIVV